MPSTPRSGHLRLAGTTPSSALTEVISRADAYRSQPKQMNHIRSGTIQSRRIGKDRIRLSLRRASPLGGLLGMELSRDGSQLQYRRTVLSFPLGFWITWCTILAVAVGIEIISPEPGSSSRLWILGALATTAPVLWYLSYVRSVKDAGLLLSEIASWLGTAPVETRERDDT